MEAVQAHILALITAIVGIVVGFGFIDNALAGEITAASATLLAAVFSVANVFHVKIGSEATTAVTVAHATPAPQVNVINHAPPPVATAVLGQAVAPAAPTPAA